MVSLQPEVLMAVKERLEKDFSLFIPEFHCRWYQHQLCDLAKQRGFPDVHSFAGVLIALPGQDPLWEAVIHAVTVHETYFFRNGATVVKALQSAGRQEESLSFLSLGCSFGQEVYTAFLVARSLYPKTEIRGTGIDISKLCVESATQGVFDRGDNFERLEPFLKDGDISSLGTGIQFSHSIRSSLTFIQGSIFELPTHITDRYQVIFCQNCLTYYDNQTRLSVANRLSECLEPGGMLVFAGAELLGNVPKATVLLSDEWPQIFVKEF